MPNEAIEFFEDALNFGGSGSYKLTKDVMIVMDIPQDILIEWRWFVVDGKIIDGSMYRRNGQLKKEHVNDENLWPQELANKWLPAPNCVMDTCLLDNGEVKVVEFNCINGSGFYDHDIKKIMTAWMDYYNI